ncbi:Phosphoenolpyruvate carboxykinase GTP [Taenia solium]|eukprot:TsM_000763700 transcript=TsM_000763700 gene=TsM_000763700
MSPSLWEEEKNVTPKAPFAKGKFSDLPAVAQPFVAHWANVCTPKEIFICDGSKAEADKITEELLKSGTLRKLAAYENNYICCTDPKDVARVESKTFICTPDRYGTVPHVAEGVKGILGQWISPKDLDESLRDRFPGCMNDRTLYVLPFSMGPIGSPLAKYGIQITDSQYVVLCMRIMTRMSPKVLEYIKEQDAFVRCLHSIGLPLPHEGVKVINNWPCNPEKTIISHIPDDRLIMSFGSGYGGNSLLGKKCFALRIASRIAYDEGWMAEHMLIMSVTNPKGEEKFVCAAFPSACGKTNMAMLTPSLPGWKVMCVGDDIAWMRFNDKGELRAINPEAGFFGVAPGTNHKTNPNALECCMKNSVLTNVAETEDGRFFWEGLESEYKPETKLTTWLGEKTTVGAKTASPKAHPNSRFCCPASQCPIIHPKWEDPAGVPVSVFMFGGRRPEGIPLVYEARTWKHGVMIGAQVKSEATAAAEFKGRQVMHDPMAMRPFMGYNFGKYLEHWLAMEKPGRHMPRIFHVNWFRLDSNGRFAWPGFGNNIRVIEWALRRVAGEDIAVDSPIGLLPKKGSINMEGLDCDWDAIFGLDKKYLLEDIEETTKFLDDQVGIDLPKAVKEELEAQRKRIQAM